MRAGQCKTNSAKRQCPICHAATNYHLFDLHYTLFDDTPLPGLMSVVACCRCGFVHYDTSASEKDFNDFYARHYAIHAYGSDTSDYQKDKNYLRGISRFLIEGGVDKQAHIADLGCGQGQLIRFLAQEGFSNLLGIELCAGYVEQLVKDGIPARVGSVLDTFTGAEKKDVLIYKHIFEHLYDISEAAKSAAGNLNPGGFLFIAVPDASRYNEFSDYAFLHYMTIEHINHFDRHHLQTLFRNFGFSLVHNESKMLDIAEDYPFPILTCLFKKDLAPMNDFPDGNFALADRMLDLFEDSHDLNTPALLNLRNTPGRIYVWGLSYRTCMYLAMSELKNCRIEAYVDIDPHKQGKIMNGHKVLSPDILEDCTADDTLVIGVGPSSTKMEALIRQKGFRGNIIRLT